MQDPVVGALWFIIFIISTTFHEAAHAFAAYKMGDDTAFRGGQVSLNPMPHIRREPIGMVVLPLISFFLGGWMIGWASTPYNAAWGERYPKKAAAMAAAGPIGNFLLIIVSVICIRVLIAIGYFVVPETVMVGGIVTCANHSWYGALLAQALSIMFSLNVLLMLFNLLPVPPLDGSGLIPMYLSDEAAQKYLHLIQMPQFRFGGLMLAWYAFDKIFPPVHLACINLLYPGYNFF
ncbi:MAG: site-2 protease family protein [Ignavibacteria bacterium]|nr:site-2 protease family protein [Ignavibacteria bacterium]